MSQVPSRSQRVLFVASGVVLVGLFLTWLVVRRHEAVQPLFAMDSVWGWVAHGAVLLCLLGGVALLARGTFRSSGEAERDTGERDS